MLAAILDWFAWVIIHFRSSPREFCL